MKTETRPCPARSALWLAVLFALFAFSRGQSQTVPALVNYQGRLANPDGSPLPTADYTLTFNLYDAATNGARVWGPQVFDAAVAQGHGARVPVVQGWFNVMLGPVDTNGASLADAFNGTSRYVEVTVSNRPPIAPRQQILTTPFAFQAANSAKLAGYDWSAVFGTNDPMAGTIPFSKLAQRQVGTNVGVGGVAMSPVLTNFSVGYIGEFTQVSTLTVNLVTTGRPVMVCLLPGDAAVNASVRFNTPIGTPSGYVAFLRGTNMVGFSYPGATIGGDSGLYLPPSSFWVIDTPPAATNTYGVSIQEQNGGGATMTLQNVKLVAFEL